MHCKNQIKHTVVVGDTLFSLAHRYNTTVGRLLELNPGVEVYNLQIGSQLMVCAGDAMPSPIAPPIGTVPPTIEPPITPAPPIGIIPVPVAPPVMPIAPVRPPIGVAPPCYMRDMLLHLMRWIREHLGEEKASEIISAICREWNSGR